MESLLNQIYLKKENLDNYLHKATKSSFSEPFFILILLFFVSFHIYTFIFRKYHNIHITFLPMHLPCRMISS